MEGALSRGGGSRRSRSGRAIALRKLRLACGLTLFTYVALHLLDHALNNISVAAAEAGLLLQKEVIDRAELDALIAAEPAPVTV